MPADINCRQLWGSNFCKHQWDTWITGRRPYRSYPDTVNYFDIPLAVTQLNFSAAAQTGHSARLKWTTTANDEEALFSVQRSTNGTDWTTLNDIRGEIAETDKTYQYTDNSCRDNTAYYRLQVLHAAGTTSYSRTVQVNFENESLNVYPNPATDYIIDQA